MEPQTCLELNAALDAWRQELEAEPTLTPETRRELEAHVRDSVAELWGRGLNDEEAFCLARRRIGRAPELAQEFRKDDPRSLARQQALWVAAGMLAIYAWSLVSNTVTNMAGPSQWHWFSWIVPALMILYLARRETYQLWPRSRWKFAGAAAIAIATLEILVVEARPFPQVIGFVRLAVLELTVFSLYPAALIAIVVWLMPANAASSKHASV